MAAHAARARPGLASARIAALAALCCVLACATAAASGGGWNNEMLAGPPAPADFPAWFENVTAWRKSKLASVDYNGSIYNTQLLWTPSSFVSPQVMIHERTLFDSATGQFTVDAYLDDLITRYGGIDSVLLWQSYPNIGIDNRNQFDMLRDLPGGLTNVAKVVDAFHARGVHVLWPYNPWDQGTRDEGQPDYVTLPQLLATIHADGFNGDTMGSIPQSFWDHGVQDGNPLAMEPEGGGDLASLNYTKMGWGEAWSYPFIPSVDTWKWLEHKHITHACDRWAWNHTSNIQAAYFNGDGFVSWENVWGIWQGMTPRDSAALRAVSAIQRFFAPVFTTAAWTPHTPEVVAAGVYASKWVPPVAVNDALAVWTIVNRANATVSGPVLTVTPTSPSNRFYDCYRGKELAGTPQGNSVSLSVMIEAVGYGCVIETSSAAPSASLSKFLDGMSQITAVPLATLSAEMIVLPQSIVPIPPAPVASQPAGTIKIPAATAFNFSVHGIMIETDNDRPGVDFQYPWESFPTLYHSHVMAIGAFYLDKYTFTNDRFKAFLQASAYQPKDPHNFLRDWANGTYPSGWGNRPVTWVSFDDARAACKWAGGRLPHEWEWQYAAQADSNPPFTYPWGDDWNASNAPAPDNGRTMRGPDPVDAHPGGASKFGVEDLVGNVWQWTDEYEDPHTRAASLKGGSYYRPQGSMWYFPQGHELNTHGKYLLLAPSLDRAGTLGFRCAYDLPTTA